MWTKLWMSLHSQNLMRTIQMTIDEPLLKAVDRTIRQRKTTRSAFIREAIASSLKQSQTQSLEQRHVEGYARAPVTSGELDGWGDEQDWGAK